MNENIKHPDWYYWLDSSGTLKHSPREHVIAVFTKINQDKETRK